MRVAVVFPGQGTQIPGMGRPWRQHAAWSEVVDAERVTGEPLAELLLDAPAERLTRTREAQLAVLTSSLVAWRAAAPLLPRPIGFAGHSLGQVSALVAAGTLGVADGVRFAARRAAATQAAADEHPGCMAALLGATVEQAETACAAARDGGHRAWLANDNAPGQVVVAGTPEGVAAAVEAARADGVRRARSLDVGGAFHTPLMAGAEPAVAAALAGVDLAAPIAPVVSNHDGVPYDDGEGWRRRLVEHVTTPVRFRAGLEALAALGADVLVEVGTGTMIAGLAKRTVPGIRVVGVDEPADLDQLAALA